MSSEEEEPKTYGWCSNSRRWLIFMDLFMRYPKTCPYNADCDRCSYFEERKATAYLLRVLKIFKE